MIELESLEREDSIKRCIKSMTTGFAGVGIDAVIYVLIATVGTVVIFMGVTSKWGPKTPEVQRPSDSPEVEDFYEGGKSRKKIKIKRKTIKRLLQ